jgi:glutamate synthase (NADPH/NADH) small chain
MTQADSLAEVEAVRQLGVNFLVNTEIVGESEPSPASADRSNVDNGEVNPPAHAGGSDRIAFSELQSRHDAVFIGVGLGATNRLNIVDENLAGVMDALDFIERVKTRDWAKVPVGRTVAVIGAGNTAIDAVTQAKRLGAERVLMVYRKTEKDIPAYDYEYELAKRDGVEFVWQAAPIAILEGENGSALSLRCEAIGQQKQFSFFENVARIETDEKGRVIVNQLMQTSNPRVFAGGDCVNGGAEAVDASQMGKLAAQGIHFTLTGEQVEFAGAHLPFIEKVPAH